jgi:DNA-directed RNA polymerase
MKERTRIIDAGGILAGTSYDEQYEIERRSIEAGAARYRSLARRAIQRGDGASLRSSERLVLSWLPSLRDAIAAGHRSMAAGEPGTNFAVIADIAPRLDAEQTALIAVRRMISVTMAAATPLSSLAYQIGRDCVEQIHHDLHLRQYAADEAAAGRIIRHCSPRVLRRWMRKTDAHDYWSMRLCGAMGLWLVEQVLHHCFVVPREGDPAPAFEARLRPRPSGLHQHTVVEISDAAATLIEDGIAFRSLLRPRLTMMVVPPMRWSQESGGGYLSIRTPLLARQRPCQTAALKESPPTAAMQAINSLASVPWSISGRTLDTLEEVWSQGGTVAGLPPREPRPKPPRPLDERAVKEWKREAAAIHRRNIEDRSHRFSLLSAMAEARRWRSRTVYQPWQLDFRGRCYPLPLGLNHQQGDAARSLMLFDSPQPVDERWLRIHAANCFGIDKAMFTERIEWVRSHSSEISRTASDPVGMLEWWSQADSPWQFLTACFALDDPSIAARLPVQIDGTANGLQHYAAIGRDRTAAAAVNMVPGRPRDPYTEVLSVVRPKVAADASAGNAEASRVLPWCSRAAIKQTVMTVPYNVTRIGAGRQCRDNLRGEGMAGTPREIGMGGGYLAGVVLDSIGEVFRSAVEIMRWIEASARQICGDAGANLLRWTSPDGFVVVQPYHLGRQLRVRAQRYSIMLQTGIGTNDRRAQTRGGPPNIVHSLDSDHFRRTAVRAAAEQMPFSGVHDSYWTASGHMDLLGHIVREEFVAMHNADPLGQIDAEWRRRYGVDIPPLPPRGDWDVAECLDAEYMFA